MTSSVVEIQRAILALAESDFSHLIEWINELDWERWDQQIESDSEAGKLDHRVAQALVERGMQL